MMATPVVQLNHAVALSYAGKLEQGYEIVKNLEDRLTDYQPYHAALADLAARSGDVTTAKIQFAKAIALSDNLAEQLFLSEKSDNLGP